MQFYGNKFFRIGNLLILVVFVSVFLGCSTQKDSFVNRAYHSINAKYNGFFNARESYREGVRRLDELHTDNYEQILSVFRYGTEQDASSVSGNMDITYEKASLVIRRHSMNIRGQEYNKWIDESYYLIGRAHFFKRDYTLAILTFEYIIRQYDPRRSYDAKVWIAKSYHEQERYDQASRMLELLERHYHDGLLVDETVALFRKAYADHFIRQGKYQRAARELEKGIPYEESRHERSRLTFIQAQLYQHSDQFAKAQQTYGRVLQMRPDRSMAFQARIGMAMAYDPSVGGSEFIREELIDLLSADRYRLYRDQVYYALAQLALRQNDEADAIKMLERSVEVSEDNDMQKGLSFLRLGEIFFQHPDYRQANIYYDSATTYLPRSYEAYEEVSGRQQILSGLARLSEVIEREDSLQTLAALPEEEQRAVVDNIISELREQERLREQAERERMQAMREAGRTARHGRGGMGGQDMGWYFYNINAISNGEMEFFSRYGDRPLEDLWRISNKQMIAGDFGMDMPGFEDLESDADTVEFDQYDRDNYLRNIPNTEEQMRASKNRQMQSYYNKGLIFRDQLRDIDNAAGCFQTIIRDYPGTDMELPAYYHLYYLLRQQGDLSGAETVKNDLVSLYPESEYAKIIGDPGYANRVRNRQNMAEELYRESYDAFFAGRYDVISQNRQALDTLEASRELKARFAYLYAMALGKSDEKALFVSELQNVVNDFEDPPVHQPATILLASLDLSDVDMMAGGEREGTRSARRESEPIESPFNVSLDDVHFFVFVVNSKELDPAGINRTVSEFNEQSFSDNELAVSTVFFEEDKHLVTVTNFQGMENGMDYYQEILQSENFAAMEDSLEAFVISVDNYPMFYEDKELDTYRTFFNHYYLGL